MNLCLQDTIAALATAPGPGMRAVIRLSGDDALRVLQQVFTPDGETPRGQEQNAADPAWRDASPALRPVAAQRARRVTGSVRLSAVPAPLPVDAWVWPTARSYTGQPSVEVHCVSSPPLIEALLAELYVRGARPAQAGEFTLRAFLAGRIDLLQAEAVLGVIDATDEQQLSAALSQLAGGISGRIAALHESLLLDLADLEAGLDFVDEDIEFVDRAQMQTRLLTAIATLDTLVQQSADRMHAAAGAIATLAGLPNAGKSSLFNALVERDAAIVSPEQGTTRDWLSAAVVWDGCRFELQDTAGQDDLRNDISAAARVGTDARIADADLVIWCTAAGLAPHETDADDRARRSCLASGPRMLHVRTKGDLDQTPTNGETIVVSSQTGEGLDRLRQAVVESLARRGEHVGELLGSTAARCRESLRAARDALQRALELVESRAGDELIAVELRSALEQTGHVAGQSTTDDLLDRIFSRFCIGK